MSLETRNTISHWFRDRTQRCDPAWNVPFSNAL